ncbi:cyclin-dependent kinase G-1-like [Argentina anserina]|uniref:cyclin-dependent kinase G-1-like n=1 Tax=Argentina anserina TaxID=57926 RepID=UPI0021762B4B|nr:cyclin-dependent kinase G-1-like [Potentilla anserina]
MATGRVEVFRRRDSPKYSKRESEFYRNGFSGVELSRGSDGGARCRDEVRDLRRSVENGRAPHWEGAVVVLPEKKRKFTPIVWEDKEEKKARTLTRSGVVPCSAEKVAHDVVLKSPASDIQSHRGGVTEKRKSPEGVVSSFSEKRKSPVTIDREEKKVRIASKNRVVKVAPVTSPASHQPTQINGVSSKSPISEIQSQGVEVSEAEASVAGRLVEFSQSEGPADLHTPICKSEAQSNLHDKDQTRISMSRWASDTDSPMQDGRGNSSPESGEIRREDSVGPRSRTSSSDEESNSVREEETGGVDGDASGGHMYSDSEDDSGLPQIEESPVSRGRSTNMLQGCRSVAEFAKLDGMLGEGTYGVVYKARDKQTGEIVAIKKVKMDKSNEGFPITSLREINILLACNHPSIVGVKEVVHNGDDIFMVMECMEYELKLLTEATKQPFSIGEVKYLVKSLLEGVKYLHDNWILHRDLKTSNILLNKEGELKICDFGLSRQYGSPLKPYTSLVVTLWYRAPELLLGQKQYSTAIDMWSVGCIMAELLAKEALFPGKSEVEQLDKIFRTLGTPNETDWPGVSNLPGFKAIQVRQRENLLRKKFAGTCFTGSPMLSASGLDLLTRLLTYDPAQRISVDDALGHDWFKDYPEPRPYKPSPTVHDRYMILRQRQEKEHLERARRGKR